MGLRTVAAALSVLSLAGCTSRTPVRPERIAMQEFIDAGPVMIDLRRPLLLSDYPFPREDGGVIGSPRDGVFEVRIIDADGDVLDERASYIDVTDVDDDRIADMRIELEPRPAEEIEDLWLEGITLFGLDPGEIDERLEAAHAHSIDDDAPTRLQAYSVGTRVNDELRLVYRMIVSTGDAHVTTPDWRPMINLYRRPIADEQ